MKTVTLMAALILLAGCASPAPSTPTAPHSNERSDQAYEELDREMKK